MCLIESNPDHLRVWHEVQDHFLLQMLDRALNNIPDNEVCFSDMSEKELSDWLSKQNFSQKNKLEYDINCSSLPLQASPQCDKSKMLIFPLSLENNATVNGTAAIIEEFGRELCEPCEHAKEYLPFDAKNKLFDIDAARKHHEFLALYEHKKMLETIHILSNAEKAFESHLVDDDEDASYESCTQLNKQKVNAKFENVCKNMVQHMWEVQQGDDDKFSNFIGWLNTHRDVWENARDFHGRTLLHSTTENGNLPLVKTLVCAGVNINAKERRGATALTIAVIKKNEEICRFLLDNFASFDDHFFPTMPSSHAIARMLELNIANIMDEKSKEEIANNIELWKTVQNTEKIEQKKADEMDVS